jgi:predicted amidohydrolase
MFLDLAQVVLTRVARETSMTIIAGMERVGPSGLLASALVVGPRGILGWQDKVQTDPSEDGIYIAGTGRRLFEVAGVKFGVCLCHEGWRYPETVRWAARRGAQIVFHPQYSPAVHGSAPRLFCEPDGTFHSKAAICRAVENGIFFATVNYAVDESCTTSAVISPTGEVLCNQPYGEPGLLFADIEPAAATAVLARRLRAEEYA